MRMIAVRVLWVIILIAMAYAIRAPLLKRDVWNLDEGSTFTMAQQVLAGDVLYRDAADNRAPLVPYLKAIVFAVFGNWNGHAVHVVIALGLGVSAVLLWQLGRLMGAERAGVVASIVFTVLSFLLLGLPDTMAAHTEWFLLFFSLLGYLIFAARAPARGGFWSGAWTGAAFGLAAMCKQPGLLDLGTTWVLCGLLAWENAGQRRRLAAFVLGEFAGVATVFGGTFLYFFAHHAVADFIFYAWTYNTKYYVPEVPLGRRLAAIQVPFFLIWHHVRIIGVVAILAGIWLLTRATRSLVRRQVSESLLAWMILGWTAAGLLSTTLSGRDFSHYSIQVMPGLSLACGWFVDLVLTKFETAGRARLVGKIVIGTVLAGLLVMLGADVRARRQALTPHDDDTMKIIGAAIQEYTGKKDRIFVWGYVPEAYYFSHRLPSSRFIYTNYVTGLIPWTNLDPLIDTAYASVPGSWKQLEDDLKATPPELVVDTGTTRGYSKYLLTNQAHLWNDVHSNYAEVEPSVFSHHGVRLFRRDRPVTPSPFPKDVPERAEVKLTSRIVPKGTRDLTTLTINAPAGAAQVDLYRNGALYRSVAYPVNRLCEVCFWVDNSDQPSSIEFQAVVHAAGGASRSAPSRTVNFGAPADLDANASNAGPYLSFGPRRLATATATSVGRPVETAPQTSHWSGSAPAQFTYARPRGMTALVLVAGANVVPAKKEGPVRLVVSFISPDGKKEQLQERFLNIDPNRQTPGEDLQTIRAMLPGADPGEIMIEFSPGGSPESSYPPIFIQGIRAQGSGPDLVLAPDQILVPEQGYSAYGGILTSFDGQVWGAHAPSVATYQCPPGVRGITVGFGLREGAFVDPQTGARRTDGIEAIIAFQPKGSEERVLFRRLLDPFNRPEDRGPQSARVELPDAPLGGTLRLTLTNGPLNDPSYDWAFLTGLVGELAP